MRELSQVLPLPSVGNDEICEFITTATTLSRANSTAYVHTFDTLATFCNKVNLQKPEFQQNIQPKARFRLAIFMNV